LRHHRRVAFSRARIDAAAVRYGAHRAGMLGASILDKLEEAATVNSAVKWAVRFLGQDSGINVGDPATQYMIDQLAASNPPALTAPQAAALKNLALQPAPVSPADVADALFEFDGTPKWL
jgi:hypothetical protein